MNAGFHSVNGLKTSQNSHIWSTFVVPRIVYGLLLNRKSLNALKSFKDRALGKYKGYQIRFQIVFH